MQFRNDKKGQPISALGYGCMRFPKNGTAIDMDKTEELIVKAVEEGINYFDTAYIYPGSEAALGKIVEKRNLRDKIRIATKLPQYLIKSRAGIDRYFNEQLERLRTDHIDYYLMHMLTDIAAWEKLVRLGILDWINEKKQSGQIINLGFSFHGNSDMFVKILDAYDWDFCQIQYNYMDENTQAGRVGLNAAAAKNIPVIIMEPLRGGRLVDQLPVEAKEKIRTSETNVSAAKLALRWLWDQPEVTCILSGMNSMEQLTENIDVASETLPGTLTQQERSLIEDIKGIIDSKLKVPCTGCRYCMPCPKGIDIPTAFSCYNHMYTENKAGGRHEYLQIMAFKKDMAEISDCVNCRKCVQHCPQSIDVPSKLVEAEKALVPWYYKLAIKAIRLVKFW